MKKKREHSSPSTSATVARVGSAALAKADDDPATRREIQKLRFGTLGTAFALSRIESEVDDNLAGAFAHITDTLAALQPRDAVEAMLIEQMTLTHARIVRLSAQSLAQRSESWRQTLSEEYERASNLFRRRMLALHEYRQPPKRTFVAVHHANIAGQQIVQQQIGGAGANDDDEQEALPTLRQRPFGASISGEEEPSLAAFHRSEDAKGQEKQCPKRAEARPSIRSRNR
jgi:hypothetical protein